MERKIYSWWRDTRRLFIRYTAVGLAFLPSALVYAALPAAAQEKPWVELLAVAAGLPLAHLAWRKTVPKPAQITSLGDDQQAVPDVIYGSIGGLQFATAVLATSIILVVCAPPHQSYWHPGDGHSTTTGSVPFHCSEL